MDVKPVVLALSQSGASTARAVAAALGAKVHGRSGRVDKADAWFDDALEHARALFASGTPIVGVCAAGILIRALAPLLTDKRTEPPVVSIADDGSVVVPLLGGHRGANRLARRIADATGAQAAITTAGDVALQVALDAPPEGYRLANPEDAKEVMAALLSGAGVRQTGTMIFDLESDPNGRLELAVTDKPVAGSPERLVYHPRTYALGVGCARDTAPSDLGALVDDTLRRHGIAAGSIASVNTIDLKADEPAVIALANRLGVPLRVFSAAELETERTRLANPSETVFAEVGCHGVAEGAALSAAGPTATLAVEKTKTAMSTCALARSDQPITTLKGRSRGRVALVGIGPGKSAWRTPEASRLIAEADELVGYSLYLDLLGPLASGKARADFGLGDEEARCRYALERAGEGRSVAIICSGDAGIYAMGALVFELLDRGDGLGDAARRVEVLSAPGVSALQAAAALAGAPLGHDFCAISLSDLLTPRTDIQRRIRAAAEGDFVIAFYNPVSKRRRTLLVEARDILLAHRPAETPVLLASSLGRPEQMVSYCRLDALQVSDVDMLTVVLIGSSASRLVARGEGPRMYTPRGYAKKMNGQAG